MDHNLNDESENIHNVDAFNDAINELNSDELATTNISDFEMEQGNSLSLEENYIIIDDKRIAFNLNTKQDYDLLSTT